MKLRFFIILGVVAAVGLVVSYRFMTPSNSLEKVVEFCEDIDIPITVYGINVDSLGVSAGEVERNSSLSAILDQFGVVYPTIFQLYGHGWSIKLQAPVQVFSLR